MNGEYYPGAIVEVIDNAADHDYDIGQFIELVADFSVDEKTLCWKTKALPGQKYNECAIDKTYDWWVYETDVRPVVR